MAKAKSKYPVMIFVTEENEGGEDAFFSVHHDDTEALDMTDGDTVATYTLLAVRKGQMVAKFED